MNTRFNKCVIKLFQKIGGTLKSVSDCYKMCNEAADIYPHALEFVPEYYKIQKMCDKAVPTHPSTIRFVPECYDSRNVL